MAKAHKGQYKKQRPGPKPQGPITRAKTAAKKAKKAKADHERWRQILSERPVPTTKTRSSTPEKEPKPKPPKVAFEWVEERNTISVPGLGVIDGEQALELIDDPDFFIGVYEKWGWDPVWVWRYLRYRLNGVYKHLLVDPLTMTAVLCAVSHIVDGFADMCEEKNS